MLCYNSSHMKGLKIIIFLSFILLISPIFSLPYDIKQWIIAGISALILIVATVFMFIISEDTDDTNDVFVDTADMVGSAELNENRDV